MNYNRFDQMLVDHREHMDKAARKHKNFKFVELNHDGGYLRVSVCDPMSRCNQCSSFTTIVQFHFFNGFVPRQFNAAEI